MGYAERAKRTAKRIVIVGTAPSWRQTPWDDPQAELWSLNDAYRMKGFKRADRWFDFHPLDRYFFTEAGKPVYAHHVPPGYYCRPAGHLEWLGSQQIPIYLNPGYKEQHPPAASWLHAHPFPKADLEAYFGRYFTSSPAWMLALAMMEGAKDVMVTGIHLATEHEYIEQRPNWEFLCGRLLGPGKLRYSVKDGFRHYETADAHLTLPESSPVVQSDFQYAFQPRPRAALEPLKWDLHRFGAKRERALTALREKPWWKRKAPIVDQIEEWEAYVQDTQHRMQRVQAGAQA